MDKRFRSARFFNQPVLLDCLNGRQRLTIGSSGPAVKVIQQVLIELGFPPTKGGVDSRYGQATADAVFRFKQKKNIRNASGQIDGIVGPLTMEALDAALGGDIVGQTDPRLRALNTADLTRSQALRTAIAEIDSLKAAYAPQSSNSSYNPPPANNRVVIALKRTLYIPDETFWWTLEFFRMQCLKNLYLGASGVVKFALDTTHRQDVFAWCNDNLLMAAPITFADLFFESLSPMEQAQILTHEFFHLSSGLTKHYYGTHFHSEAIVCVDHLASAVIDVGMNVRVGFMPINRRIVCKEPSALSRPWLHPPMSIPKFWWGGE